MKISVVIPTYNREKYILRAVKSVIKQTIDAEIEIVIVDDASVDETDKVIKKFVKEKPVVDLKLIKNKKSFGRAKARNIGAENSSGEYVAFLDSDDEWLLIHLEKGIHILKTKYNKGLFVEYYVSNGEEFFTKKLQKKEIASSLVDYIFSKNGDTRTSTFIFKKQFFDKIKFDSTLNKHQDWDLAIRFADEYGMNINYNPTVIIHNNVNNRMSKQNNHPASQQFFCKHSDEFSTSSKTNYFTNLAANTLRYEGENEQFLKYLKCAKENVKFNNFKTFFKLLILQTPGINVMSIYDKLKSH